MLELNRDPARLINWFDAFGGPNPYEFLSNFHRGGRRLAIDGHDYPTAEHAFQAYKATSAAVHQAIRNADDPGTAKALGRTCDLRPDWDGVRYDVMSQVLRVKFAVGTDLAQRLLDTGDAVLVEGTFWDDRVWGVDLTVPGWPGQNWLGRLLMAHRAELRHGATGRYSPSPVRLWFDDQPAART